MLRKIILKYFLSIFFSNNSWYIIYTKRNKYMQMLSNYLKVFLWNFLAIWYNNPLGNYNAYFFLLCFYNILITRQVYLFKVWKKCTISAMIYYKKVYLVLKQLFTTFVICFKDQHILCQNYFNCGCYVWWCLCSYFNLKSLCKIS